MAYGNVTPPTLPTYDAETNGFYLLVFNYELEAENWYMVHLIYGAWRFQYEEGVGITNTGNTFTRTYSDGVWSEESQNTVALALNPGVNGQVYQRIYTNANIFNGDEIWLAENTVTPLDEEQRQINMKSQLAGFLAAWCSPVRQFPQGEQWKTLWEGEITPLAQNSDGFYVIVDYAQDYGKAIELLPIGTQIRLTLDGESRVYSLGGETKETPSLGVTTVTERRWCGNVYLDDTTATDDGFGMYIKTANVSISDDSTNPESSVKFRTDGTHTIKIEMEE